MNVMRKVQRRHGALFILKKDQSREKALKENC